MREKAAQSNTDDDNVTLIHRTLRKQEVTREFTTKIIQQQLSEQIHEQQQQNKPPPTYKEDTTLRQKMLDGQIDGGCSYCIKREANGINRREYHNYLLDGNYESFQSDYLDITFLELRLGNFCNLKCTMCGPYASSQWSAEVKKINISLQSST